MQRPIAFSDDIKAKEKFKPFIEKWTARAGSKRALPFTAGGKEMRSLVPDLLTPARSKLDSHSMAAYLS